MDVRSLQPLGDEFYRVMGVRVHPRTGHYIVDKEEVMNIHLDNPRGLGEKLVGKRISHYENFSRGFLKIYLESGEVVTVEDPLGIHVGYSGYFDSPVESVEHVGHGTFIRSLDGSDLLRFVTVGWSA